IILTIMILPACSDEGRSYSIDQVKIDAQIEDNGVIQVRELYTYTFDGSFEGMTRSVFSDVDNFKAFETYATDPTIETDGLEELKVEKDEDDDQLLKIHTASENETKSVLYSYEVNGSVKKYADVADLKYSFFDESNETDLQNVDIAIRTPGNSSSENFHVFLHADNNGELIQTENSVQYKVPELEAGETSEMRLIFPAEQLPNAEILSDEEMGADILAEERELAKRRSNLHENMQEVTPFIWLVMLGAVGIAIFLLIVHPNRYQGDKSIDKLIRELEKKDPLFVKYIDLNENLDEEGFIAGLLSLKQRDILKLEEVACPFKANDEEDEGETTLRFTYIEEHAELDQADNFLIEWLFTEKDEQGCYFLLDSVIAQDEESDDEKEEKAERFQKQFRKWKELVDSREAYQDLRRSFHGFPVFSILTVLASFGLIYQFTKIDLLSSTEQWMIPLLFGVFAFVVMIFCKNKWVITAYYLAAVTISMVFFSATNELFLLILCLSVTWIALMIVPSYVWREDVKVLKKAINTAYHEFKKKRYPVDANPEKIERRLEYAVILGAGKEYGEQCGESEKIKKWRTAFSSSYPLLNNPGAVSMFDSNYLILYTTSVGSSASSNSSTTSSTGGGGAGAF